MSEAAEEKDTWNIHITACQSFALTADWQVCCYEPAGWFHELTDNVINNLISSFILYKLHCTKIVLMFCECYIQINHMSVKTINMYNHHFLVRQFIIILLSSIILFWKPLNKMLHKHTSSKHLTKMCTQSVIKITKILHTIQHII
jgi:hypothetical protein